MMPTMKTEFAVRTNAEARRTQGFAEKEIKLRVSPRPLRLGVSPLLAALLLCVLALTPHAVHAQTNNLTALLQQGLFEEQANRNLDAAIENYAMLARQFDKDRQLAATAVFRLGECYRAQGKTNEAAAQYERILRDFPDQTTLATLSRQNLTGMGAAKTETAAVENSDAQLLKKLEGKPLEELEKTLPTLIPDTTLDALLKKRYEAQSQRALLVVDYATDNVNVQRADATLAELNRQIEEKITGMMQGLKLRAELVGTPQKPGRASLVEAAASGRSAEDKEIEQIERLIQTSPDLINSEDGQSATRTPLITAAWCGWLKVAAYLLDHGADVNRSAADVVQSRELADAGRASPLLAAVSAGNKAMTRFLIEHGANVNFKGENNGVTPLHLAARKGFQAVAEVLLANRADANAKDNAGQTPLFSAVQGGQTKIVQMLIAAGANPNLKDGKDNTVLNFAIKTSPEMFKALLAAGTDPNTEDARGRTPLSYAVERDSLEVVKILLAAKADPNAGQSDAPLLAAIHKKNVAAVDLLLQAGAKPNAKGMVDLSSSTFSGGNTRYSKTPLSLAVSTGQLPMVELLLKYKADPNDSQTDGRPVVFSALSDTNILETLLDSGAKVDVRDATTKINNKSLNWTPLIWAVNNNSASDIVEILLRYGANPNVQDASFGNTPLHWSTGWDSGRIPDRKVLELLLNYKADPNMRNNGGQTLLDNLKNSLKPAFPKDEASINNLADLLRQHGALDNLPDWDRITISRPSASASAPVFLKNTNDWNHFTLLELLLQVYHVSGPQIFGEALTKFPDLSGIVIVRPSANGAGLKRIPVNLLNATNGVDGSRDVPLEFGDVVEIPEREHTLAEGTTYLTQAQFMSMLDYFRSKRGEVKMVVSGAQTVSLPLQPMFSQIGAVLTKGDARAALTSKSALSRVKVIRHDPKSGKKLEWILDCSSVDSGNGNNAPDLWLQDGDVIEVPEKP